MTFPFIMSMQVTSQTNGLAAVVTYRVGPRMLYFASLCSLAVYLNSKLAIDIGAPNEVITHVNLSPQTHLLQPLVLLL